MLLQMCMTSDTARGRHTETHTWGVRCFLNSRDTCATASPGFLGCSGWGRQIAINVKPQWPQDRPRASHRSTLTVPLSCPLLRLAPVGSGHVPARDDGARSPQSWKRPHAPHLFFHCLHSLSPCTFLIFVSNLRSTLICGDTRP